MELSADMLGEVERALVQGRGWDVAGLKVFKVRSGVGLRLGMRQAVNGGISTAWRRGVSGYMCCSCSCSCMSALTDLPVSRRMWLTKG